MKLINLTPHEINLCGTKIAASGYIARVTSHRHQTGAIEVDGKSVPTYSITFGAVVGLQPEQDGVGYIVSAMIRSAAPERRDVYSPADLQRDSSGNVIGCGSLDSNYGC